MDDSSLTSPQLLSLLAILNEYETTNDTLTREIVFYTKQQENLQNEITTLIKENRTLAETVNHLLESQVNHKCEMKPVDTELNQNLKTQLGCAQKEKDIAIDLWQTALKTIDHLEVTIGDYGGSMNGCLSKAHVSKIKIAHDTEITQLNKHVKQLQIELDNCKNTLSTKNVQDSKVIEQTTSTYTLAKRLEADVHDLNKKLEDIMKIRNELQLNLQTKTRTISELQTKDMEAKRKVSEALQIVDAACFEKNAALSRENEAKMELLKISKTLTEIIDETTDKVKSETENIKQIYNNKLKKVQEDMLQLQKVLAEKNTELNKQLQESVRLNQELDRARKGNICIDDSHTSKLLILEKNLESTFQKLLLSEKKNLQLDAEKESIKSDLEQMSNCYKSDIRTRETEKEVMKKQLRTLKVQLRASDTNVHHALSRADKLKAQIKHLDVVIQEKLKLQQIMYEESLSKSIKGIQTNNTKIQSELQHHIQLQRNLNKKMKKETVGLINQLEKKMGELKTAKKSLQQDLRNVIRDNLYYKENLKHFCTRVMNLVEVNSEHAAK